MESVKWRQMVQHEWLHLSVNDESRFGCVCVCDDVENFWLMCQKNGENAKRSGKRWWRRATHELACTCLRTKHLLVLAALNVIQCACVPFLHLFLRFGNDSWHVYAGTQQQSIQRQKTLNWSKEFFENMKKGRKVVLEWFTTNTLTCIANKWWKRVTHRVRWRFKVLIIGRGN